MIFFKKILYYKTGVCQECREMCAKDLYDGEIVYSPKLVYWMQMPLSIDEKDKIELLKQDYFLINYSSKIEHVSELKSKCNENSAFFFDLDNFISSNKVKDNNTEELYGFISDYISTHLSNRSIVHTNLVDPKLKTIFLKKSILYIEKNFKDRKLALEYVFKLSNYIFSQNKRSQRSFIRLNLLALRIKVEILNLSKPSDQNDFDYKMLGYIKDLSLNGVSIMIHDQNKIGEFRLKELLQIKIFLNNQIIKVNQCIITRVDSKNFEVAVNYNINDYKMIREDYASVLTEVIYKWLKSIIGRVAQNDNIDMAEEVK